MSQSSNSRNPNVYAETRDGNTLPRINDKRLADVIDYSQPRPQTANDNKYGSTGVTDHNMNAPEETEGHPVQLVTADPKTGKFTLNEEFAAELITTYEGNISFVTVGGKVNSGKSFLLNNLLSLKGEGFPIDHSDDICTEGIWIWSKPVYSEKDNLYIFFLDTEGSHSVKKTAAHDAKMFAFTLLLSSYYIYNSFGSIDENSINDLSLATKLPKNIVLSAEESIEPVLSFYTPKFLWALRDFAMEIQDSQGRFLSTNQYMESALNDQNPHVKSSETNKKIRQALINCFNDRECMSFVRPIYDGREFGRLTQIQNAPIRPDFLKQVNALREKILNKITPKELKGVPLNMRMYMAMLNNYIETFNQGGVPNISEAYDYMIENECREAFEQAVDLYELAMKQFFFSEEKAKPIEELYNILKNIRDSAFDKYVKITSPMEKNELTHHFKGELKDYIDKKEQQVVAINEEFHQTNNEELLEQLAHPIKEKLEANGYGPKNIQEFHDAFNNFLETFDAEGQGLNKTTGLIQFVMNFQPEIIQALTASLTEKADMATKSSAEDKTKLNENQKALKEDLAVVEGKVKVVEEEVAKERAERDELSRKTARLNDQIQKIADEGEGMLEDEKKKTRLELNRLKDKDREIEELTRQNQEYLDQIEKRKKKACCNMF